jgi:hypothetical protein
MADKTIDNHFLWFSGTGTTAKAAEELFASSVGKNTQCIYVNGVGLTENRKDVNKLNDQPRKREKEGSVKEYLSIGKEYIMTKTSQKIPDVVSKSYETVRNAGQSGLDSAFGYKEDNQLVSLVATFNLIEGMLESVKKGKKINLIIGGHSRGSAAGMTGFLASFLAAIQANQINKDLADSIQKITLIPVDPVSGGQSGGKDTNDQMIEGGKKESSKITMEYLLEEIEAGLFKKKKIFNITAYLARFDARNQFSLDNRWFQFLNNTPKSFEGRTKSYIGGFRHSAMVDTGDEITSLYGKSTPMGLMKKLVESAINNLPATKKDADNCAELLKKKELELMAATPLHENLKVKTTLKSYGYITSKIIYSGDDLKTVLEKNKGKKKEDVCINNRYLFR